MLDLCLFCRFVALGIFTTRQRSCGKIMFSLVSVCLSVHEGSPCDHYPWCIGPFCTAPPPTTRWTSDLGPLLDPSAPQVTWHLVVITGDLLKLVHLWTPRSDMWWWLLNHNIEFQGSLLAKEGLWEFDTHREA